MSMIVKLSGLGLAVAASVEAGARIYYSKCFRMPWKSRLIGEYPYDRFIEKAPPPLFFQFKKGFRSRHVNINRFGMRGPEPAPDGVKNRMLVIGESIFFGSKLYREKDLWSYRLQERLQHAGYHRWEVLNAGVPGYNAVQYRAWWEKALMGTRPKILLLEMGGNDVTQAYVMGRKWQPGAPWPWEFIMRQQRKSPWWNKLAVRSCAYFLWRRQKMTRRASFENKDEVVKFDECRDTIAQQAQAIINDARSMGAKVILTYYPMAYNLDSLEKESPELYAIQSNWRESLENSGRYMIAMEKWWLDEFSPRVNCPVIDFTSAFRKHPQRFQMYLDIIHWNAKGHDFVADMIFDAIQRLGWW